MGPQARYGDEVFEAPVLAQAAAMRPDDASVTKVVAMVSTDERPVTLDKVRVQRQLRELAADHAEGRIGDEAYMAQVKELRRRLATFKEPTSGQVPAQHATDWLRALGETLRATHVPEAKADLLHAIYERIVVAGPEFVTAYLTPAAYAHGLAALLPEVVMAPPAGFEPATGRLEGGCSVH